MLPSWCNDTVTIVRANTSKTVRGSTVPDWSSTTETSVSGCSVQPASSTISEDGRVLGLADGMTAYLPNGTDVLVSDRVVFDGNTYTIDGEPRVWRSPTGMRSHILLNLKRWNG